MFLLPGWTAGQKENAPCPRKEGAVAAEGKMCLKIAPASGLNTHLQTGDRSRGPLIGGWGPPQVHVRKEIQGQGRGQGTEESQTHPPGATLHWRKGIGKCTWDKRSLLWEPKRPWLYLPLTPSLNSLGGHCQANRPQAPRLVSPGANSRHKGKTTLLGHCRFSSHGILSEKTAKPRRCLTV